MGLARAGLTLKEHHGVWCDVDQCLVLYRCWSCQCVNNSVSEQWSPPQANKYAFEHRRPPMAHHLLSAWKAKEPLLRPPMIGQVKAWREKVAHVEPAVAKPLVTGCLRYFLQANPLTSHRLAPERDNAIGQCHRLWRPCRCFYERRHMVLCWWRVPY